MKVMEYFHKGKIFYFHFRPFNYELKNSSLKQKRNYVLYRSMSQNHNDICIALGYYTGKIMKSFNRVSILCLCIYLMHYVQSAGHFRHSCNTFNVYN